MDFSLKMSILFVVGYVASTNSGHILRLLSRILRRRIKPQPLEAASAADADEVSRAVGLESSTTALDFVSWRLAVETGNHREWAVVPPRFKDHMIDYMVNGQHERDCEVVVAAAYEYAKKVKLVGDGKDAWVFDVDQTALSMLPYYGRPDVQYGAIEFNLKNFLEWLGLGIAPPFMPVLRLYKKLLDLGFKIVFITGTADEQRQIRIDNLKNAGYHTWERLMLRKPSEGGTVAGYKVLKRTQLVEEEGYRIWGDMSDQWCDLVGANLGDRIFKLPNPMFFVAFHC